jgi:hypothetical protein
VVAEKGQRSRSSEPGGESEFGKYLAVGVFAGALVAATAVLFLVFSSGSVQKPVEATPAQETLIQSPTQAVPATGSSPQEDPADDRKQAGNPVRRGIKKSPPPPGDDAKRKRQDIIETPGKNPKMTQY